MSTIYISFSIKFSILAYLGLFSTSLLGQVDSFQDLEPLAIEPTLAGNYGELRPNHFHAGLDLKTASREGLEVATVADGFVSRIKISPYGYGKAVYIDHPNGYTTVYGHLKTLNDTIERYIRRVQREQQSFSVDVYPGKFDLVVTKGEIIAFSGNTGGSGGPHLHFEIRETVSEVTRNPLIFGFPVSDSKSPIIEAIAITPLEQSGTIDNRTSSRRYRVSSGRISGGKVINIQGGFGIEVNGFDQQNGSSNRNGIYKIECLLDGQQIAFFKADSIPFDQSRYLNAIINYEYYYQNNSRYVRLYRLPGNFIDKRIFDAPEMIQTEVGAHEITIRAMDYSGNTSTVRIPIQYQPAKKTTSEKVEMLQWNSHYFYESEFFKIHIPKYSIYASEELSISESPTSLEIMRPQVPLHSPIVIRIRDTHIHKGVVIAKLNSKGNPSRALATTRDGDWLKAESKSFGKFGLASDLTPPKISSIDFVNGQAIGRRIISFSIADNLSGIESFSVWVGDSWILAEYDPKRNRLFFRSSEMPKSDEFQVLRIEVKDVAGNVATFEGRFIHR